MLGGWCLSSLTLRKSRRRWGLTYDHWACRAAMQSFVCPKIIVEDTPAGKQCDRPIVVQ